jgi:DNA topoisomerase-1
MTKLLIVESPSKARTITEYLGKGFTVLASVGHVRDLPKNNAKAVDIENDFKPHYILSPDKKEVVERIRAASEKASEVFLATDPDREGEAIAWHIKEAVHLKNPHRVVFHEITKNAIIEALEHPRKIDDNLRKAQEARRVLDRLVGYDLSGIIWKKVRYGLSAGRVQSPALRIVCEREREIRAFIPVEYYVLTATFSHKDGDIIALCSEEPSTAAEASRIIEQGKKASWHISALTEKEEERAPRPPFTTSTLQQVASTRLGFSPSRTMRVAQKLYEAGLITYMRTDSVTLSKDAVAAIAKSVSALYGEEHLEVKSYKTSSKNAQEAHEAIRPTDAFKTRAGSSEEEEALYKLIHARTLSSQMKNARILRSKVTFSSDADIPTFAVNGSRALYDGWLLCDTQAKGEDVYLPKVSEGQSLPLKTIESEQKFTAPPNRYSEAGLVKELEKRGIGRPSTYASIMKTIQDRGYVEKLGKTLKPTDTGMVVSGFLEEHFAEYISDSFTAEMEDELDEIARGERDYAGTLKEFYSPFSKAVQSKDSLPKATSLGEVPPEFTCPLCSSAMEYKLGRNGIFMSCTKYPDCTGARMQDGQELKPDEPLGIHPDTQKPIYIKNGKYGPYVEMPIDEVPVPEETPKKKSRSKKKPAAPVRRASIPAGKKLDEVSLADAVKYLSLPRELGAHTETGLTIIANIGRFGPYIGHNGEFRSLKKDDDPYTITLARAIEILATPKQLPKGVEKAKDVGLHPKTKKMITVYKSKAGLFLKKGLRRILLPKDTDLDTLTPEEAAAYLT